MKILCAILVLFLTGCGDRYSLDEKRGPDPKGIVTTHPLSLPPDYMLRAPEPVEKEIVTNEKPKEENNEAGLETPTIADTPLETENTVQADTGTLTAEEATVEIKTEIVQPETSENTGVQAPAPETSSKPAQKVKKAENVKTSAKKTIKKNKTAKKTATKKVTKKNGKKKASARKMKKVSEKTEG